MGTIVTDILMQIPTVSLKSGSTIPIFGVGTWRMGGDQVRNPDNDDERDISAIQKAISIAKICKIFLTK